MFAQRIAYQLSCRPAPRARRAAAFTIVAAAVAVASLAPSASAGPIGLIDDFGDADLSQYTQTKVLDQDATTQISFASPSGALQTSKSANTQAEQALFLRNDFALGVGEVLRVDTTYPGAQAVYGDFGIAVGATPTAGVRSNYIAVYANPNQDLVKSIGWDGTTQEPGTTSLVAESSTLLGLYISRTTAGDFQVGYTTAVGDVQQGAFTIADASAWTSVGAYADLRGVVTVGDLDNLRIAEVPEPASLGLIGLAGLALARRRRR